MRRWRNYPIALAVSGALTLGAAGCGGSGRGVDATGRIAFIRGKRQGSVIFTISSDGSGLRELTRQRTPHDEVSALAASPDGKWLAYSGGLYGFNGDRAYDDLYVVSSSGGPPRRITHSHDDDWDPAWSADGNSSPSTARPTATTGSLSPDPMAHA